MADEQAQQNNQQDPLKEAEAKRDEYLNGWKRAAADFANYKKEELKRFEEAGVYARAGMVKDLLPVLDSFGFALSTVDKDSPAYKGMLMIQNQFLETLKRHGIEKIQVNRGDAFDPAVHEAMMEAEIPPDAQDKDKLAGRILEELVAGYTMNGRVIRAAKVKLGKS